MLRSQENMGGFEPLPIRTDMLCPSDPQLRVGPLTARDERIHTEHLLRLPEEDRRKRFFHTMTDSAISDFSRDFDWNNNIVFGAFVDDVLRGVGTLIPVEDNQVEVAMTVEHAYQHLGIGRLLVATLLVAARMAGHSAVRLVFLQQNQQMLALAKDIRAEMVSESGVTEAVLPLAPHTP